LINITCHLQERPPSSTGSISDSNHSEEAQQKKAINTDERRPINWSDEGGEEEQTQERTILVPRRLNEVPSSRFGIEGPVVRDEVLFEGAGYATLRVWRQ
jgi:hypothetical protein